MSKHRIVGSIVSLAVIAVVIGGFMLAGTPEDARKERADMLRVERLQQIATAVQFYYDTTAELPTDLVMLREVSGLPLDQTTDPVTEESFDYSVVDERSFELCAQFDADNQTDAASRYPSYYAPDQINIFNLQFHSSGRECFTLTVKSSA